MDNILFVASQLPGRLYSNNTRVTAPNGSVGFLLVNDGDKWIDGVDLHTLLLEGEALPLFKGGR